MYKNIVFSENESFYYEKFNKLIDNQKYVKDIYEHMPSGVISRKVESTSVWSSTEVTSTTHEIFNKNGADFYLFNISVYGYLSGPGLNRINTIVYNNATKIQQHSSYTKDTSAEQSYYISMSFVTTLDVGYNLIQVKHSIPITDIGNSVVTSAEIINIGSIREYV